MVPHPEVPVDMFRAQADSAENIERWLEGFGEWLYGCRLWSGAAREAAGDDSRSKLRDMIAKQSANL